jgi:hypothetical protein
MIRIRPFKEKEKEEGEGRSQLGGQWKVPMLDGQWKVPMFDGQWKVPMFGGHWKEKEKHFFTFSHFTLPPQQILLKPSFFPLISLYHGFRSLFTHFLPFH